MSKLLTPFSLSPERFYGEVIGFLGKVHIPPGILILARMFSGIFVALFSFSQSLIGLYWHVQRSSDAIHQMTQRGETGLSLAALPKPPIKLIRLLRHRMYGVELMQIVLDMCSIADPPPTKESVVVIDTGVFPPGGVVVGDRQAGEHTIMLWIIRDVVFDNIRTGSLLTMAVAWLQFVARTTLPALSAVQAPRAVRRVAGG